MNKQSPTRFLTHVLTILFGLFSMAFCSSAIAQQHGAKSVDKAEVTAIEFRIAEDNLDQFGYDLPAAAMTTRVIDNLAGWHYPVKADLNLPYSHILQAQIGQQAHQSTPVGFSFNSGNSDPRSPEFQKADIISITCTLTAIKNPQQTVRQNMDFNAVPFIKSAKKHANQAKAADLLVDHMSTVCFNLLEDLDLKLSTSIPPGNSAPKPGWMPEIRIEIENQPAKESVPSSEAVQNSDENSESRKQITIHNQGTPVILKLGHERK